MTPAEAESILMEAVYHTPETREDYFRRKAEEGNHDPVVFFLALTEAYNRIERHVNSFDYSGWGRDENGEPVYDKKQLPLRKDGCQVWLFNSENIMELLIPLQAFGKQIQSKMEDRTEINKYSHWLEEIYQYPEYLDDLNPSKYELKKFLSYLEQWKNRELRDINGILLCNPTMKLEEAKSNGYKQLERVEKLVSDRIEQPAKQVQTRPGLQSFTWSGSQVQLVALCEALKTAGYIDQGTTKEAFTAIFADELKQCNPIRWIVSNRLLAYLFDQLYMQDYIVKEWQSIIEKYRLFQNKTGKLMRAGDLAVALSEINDKNKGLNPKGTDKIDTILKNLKTLRP